jgi:RES domain-containing protein
VALRVTLLHQDDTHRLIPVRYSDDGASVLARLTSDPQHLHDLFQLEGSTNERLLGEANLLPGITVHELVFGTPNWHIVNAAFTHARPEGSRFNGADRGAWYCAFTLETAQAEVAFHFAESLREVNWEESETATYREYLADFRGEFHDIRKNSEHASCLDPVSHVASQQLARELLNQGSAGVIYPSVRHRGGTCLACFRPALVINVRRGWVVTLEFSDAFAAPTVHIDKGWKKT